SVPRAGVRRRVRRHLHRHHPRLEGRAPRGLGGARSRLHRGRRVRRLLRDAPRGVGRRGRLAARHRSGRSRDRFLRRTALARAREHRRRVSRRACGADGDHRKARFGGRADASPMKARRKLSRSFYLHDTVSVARALLGCVLWRRLDHGELLAARIVETEAYLGANDMASHARRGLRSARNESMYLEGGHAYVYFTYGMHWCLNVVTQEADLAEAVLLRAAEPLRGIEAMRERRPKAKKERELMNGPGKICMAMDIDRRMDGQSLRGDSLWITARDLEIGDDDIAISPRIGIDNSGDAAAWP